MYQERLDGNKKMNFEQLSLFSNSYDNNYGYLAKEKSLLFNKLQPTKEDKIKCLTGSL